MFRILFWPKKSKQDPDPGEEAVGRRIQWGSVKLAKSAKIASLLYTCTGFQSKVQIYKQIFNQAAIYLPILRAWIRFRYTDPDPEGVRIWIQYGSGSETLEKIL